MRGGYVFGGNSRATFDLTAEERETRREMIHALFPKLHGVDVHITHAWGGNLGVSRRMTPHMYADHAHRVAVAGGYMGEGVGATNLAGRTLAALILEDNTDAPSQALRRLPWVVRGDITSTFSSGLRLWEPEPFRWIGYQAVMGSYVLENAVLSRPESPALLRWAVVNLCNLCELILQS